MAADACISCHAPHNAGQHGSRLLRGQDEQDCIACHNGGSNVSPAAYPTFLPNTRRPKSDIRFPRLTNPHDAAETALLNNNRHATCVDCHNAHGSAQVGYFPPPPLIRVSQKDVAGISATDGVTPDQPGRESV